MKHSILVLLLFVLSFPVLSQETIITRDTIFIEEQDTVLIKAYAKRFDPRKALLYAAVFPGLGQAYNKKYWKIPIVYGGGYLIGSYINAYNNVYREYKGHLFFNLENNLQAETARNPQTNLTTSQLRRIINRSRRERDFMIILMGGLYLLQIVDAHVDAHLKEFDINPNLKVSLEPTLTQDAIVGRQTGMALMIRF